MDDGMNLDTAFLLSGLRVSSHSLEQKVGEQRYGGGIDAPEPFHPFGSLGAPAVRGKGMAVSGVKINDYFCPW